MATEPLAPSSALAALRGEAGGPVPVSAWWHDYKREWYAADLAGTTLEAYRKFGWGFVKVNPRFTYYAEDWGARYEPFPDRMPEIREPAVNSPDDLARLQPLDVTAGAYGEQIEALRLIADGVAGEVPFVQTVFSPLAVLSRLTGSTKYVQKLMREAPDETLAALGVITQTLEAYARECLAAGASGIFYAAVEWGSADNISWEDYERFGKPYDLPVLAAADGAPFNVLHVCRDNNHLARLLDYPVAAFNWDVHGANNPDFTHVLSNTAKAVIGGISQRTMRNGNAADVRAEADRALAETEGVRFLLSPGCSIDPESPEENLRAMVEAARR